VSARGLIVRAVSALCIVATPLAAARGARRLCDAQGGILFGPAVATLDRLVPDILAASGDRRPVLSPLAERLLAVRAGRAAGGPFADLAVDGGLAGSLAAALSELRRAEVDADQARAAASRLEGGPAARLRALAAALEAHEAALRDLSVLDRAGAMRAAAAMPRLSSAPPPSSSMAREPAARRTFAAFSIAAAFGTARAATRGGSTGSGPSVQATSAGTIRVAGPRRSCATISASAASPPASPGSSIRRAQTENGSATASISVVSGASRAR